MLRFHEHQTIVRMHVKNALECIERLGYNYIVSPIQEDLEQDLESFYIFNQTCLSAG